MTSPNQITDAADALSFVTGGKATLTLKSLATGKHYTYSIKRAKDNDRLYFVGLLAGGDNESDYVYIGCIRRESVEPMLFAGRKGNAAHPAYKALDWALYHLSRGKIPEKLEVWHEGRCCRCNRKLTTPESLQSGIGPECAKKESV